MQSHRFYEDTYLIAVVNVRENKQYLRMELRDYGVLNDPTKINTYSNSRVETDENGIQYVLKAHNQISCIHVALASANFEKINDSEYAKKTVEFGFLSSENMKEITLEPEERFKAFNMWTRGIAEWGLEALLVVEEIERYTRSMYPIAKPIMTFLMRCYPINFIGEFIDKAEYKCIVENKVHKPSLLANYLLVGEMISSTQDILEDKDVMQYMYDKILNSPEMDNGKPSLDVEDFNTSHTRAFYQKLHDIEEKILKERLREERDLTKKFKKMLSGEDSNIVVLFGEKNAFDFVCEYPLSFKNPIVFKPSVSILDTLKNYWGANARSFKNVDELKNGDTIIASDILTNNKNPLLYKNLVEYAIKNNKNLVLTLKFFRPDIFIMLKETNNSTILFSDEIKVKITKKEVKYIRDNLADNELLLLSKKLEDGYIRVFDYSSEDEE